MNKITDFDIVYVDMSVRELLKPLKSKYKSIKYSIDDSKVLVTINTYETENESRNAVYEITETLNNILVPLGNENATLFRVDYEIIEKIIVKFRFKTSAK